MWPENMHVLLVVEFICLCYLCILAYDLLATWRMIRRWGKGLTVATKIIPQKVHGSIQ